MHRFIGISLLVSIFVPSLAHSQGTKADYDRADSLFRIRQNKVFKAAITAHWSPNGNTFWYRNALPNNTSEFLIVDAIKGNRSPAFDHAKIAPAISKIINKPVTADSLPIDRLQIADDGSITLLVAGKTYLLDRKDHSLKPAADMPAIPAQPVPRNGRRGGFRRRPDSPRTESSPDGKYSIITREYNLHLKEKDVEKSTPITTDGKASDYYESGVYWSPDSSHFVAIRHKKGGDRKVTLVESSPKDQLQPKVDTYEYLKPGDQIPIRKPHLFKVAGRKEITVKDDLFNNPWSVEEFRWDADSSRFTFLYNQRGHQALRIIAIDTKAQVKTIIDESSKTFIDYSNKTFTHYLDSSHEMIWMSERSGWNHLYLIDTKTGTVKHPITKGDWLVLGIERIDDDKKLIWFRAGGIHPDQDPYHVHYARVNFDGTGLVVLTEGDGTHQIDFSPDRRFYIDTYSRIDLPPVVELRSAAEGRLIRQLETADITQLVASGWKAPERFVAKGRDGKSDIYGVVFRSLKYESKQKYPVIEQIYAGPQGAFVPKRFSPFHNTEALAELGFVVVQIDGMGTNWRSKAFHDVCSKNLADAGFQDRILWMKALAAKDPGVDISRVGIYGGSAGGQNALGGMLFHPEFYKAAAADCGCHDNRMDKIWWNEAWMGWPIGRHYEAQSNVTNAHKLQGKLLLMVGELDRNVDPASTMQVANALIKANKDFEFIVFPGGGHGAGGSPYGVRRQRDFFVRNLLGVEPRR